MNAQAGTYDAGTRYSGAPENVRSDQQLHNLIEHLKRGLRVLWNSYMTSFGDDEIRGVIGIFGSADTVYPLDIYYTYVFILGVVAVVSFERTKLYIHPLWRWFAVSLCVKDFVSRNRNLSGVYAITLT